MKVVIEIPPQMYEYASKTPLTDFYERAVANGTPLKDVCAKCWLNTKEGDSDADGD